MRLLNTRTIAIEEFPPDKIPQYAILSHTWCEDEVSFHDIHGRDAALRAGYAKVACACAQALRDGFGYIWIDTCCIDKSSSAELSEAINSMFAWYNKARVCYAYLSDLHIPDGKPALAPACGPHDCLGGAWFTRGWTLQELLAPERVLFYSAEWAYLGDKRSLAEKISSITGIHQAFLQGLPLSAASIAQKMSWAAGRKTTREEDIAYSLLGIFDVHMPLLYGEGGLNAFYRLQEELLRKYDDQSLYAWHSKETDPRPVTFPTIRRSGGGQGWRQAEISTGALARSPDDYAQCGGIVLCEFEGSTAHHSTMTNTGIFIQMPICKLSDPDDQGSSKSYALLRCRRRHDFLNALAIPVERDGDVWHRTSSAIRPVMQNSWEWRLARRKSIYLAPRPRRVTNYTPAFAFNDAFLISTMPEGWEIADIHPRHARINSQMTHVLRAYPAERGLQKETILVRLKHHHQPFALLLVLVVHRASGNVLKKDVACYMSEMPTGMSLAGLYDDPALLHLGSSVKLADGTCLGIALEKRNLFKSRLFLVDVGRTSVMRSRVAGVLRRLGLVTPWFLSFKPQTEGSQKV